jgi:hypothetical protein
MMMISTTIMTMTMIIRKNIRKRPLKSRGNKNKRESGSNN